MLVARLQRTSKLLTKTHLNFVCNATQARKFTFIHNHNLKNFKLENNVEKSLKYYIAEKDTKIYSKLFSNQIINRRKFSNSGHDSTSSEPSSSSTDPSMEPDKVELVPKDKDGNIIIYTLHPKKYRSLRFMFYLSIAQVCLCVGVAPALLHDTGTAAKLLGGFLPVFGITAFIAQVLFTGRYIQQLAISEDTKKIRLYTIALFGRQKLDLDSFDLKLNDVEKRGIQAMIDEGLTFDDITRRVRLLTLQAPTKTYFIDLRDFPLDKLKEFFEIMQKYENE